MSYRVRIPRSAISNLQPFRFPRELLIRLFAKIHQELPAIAADEGFVAARLLPGQPNVFQWNCVISHDGDIFRFRLSVLRDVPAQTLVVQQVVPINF